MGDTDIERNQADITQGGALDREYPLGYSHDEFERLERQSRFFGDLTEDMLRRAGIERGMRVLDVGCGVGDVSLLAAALVGTSGTVLGIDRSPQAIETARRRSKAAGRDWVRFAAAELEAFSTEETFDAVIGRLVLMYLPEPAATLRRFCSHLRPGGIVAFQEMSMPAVRSVPEGPLFRRCKGWIFEICLHARESRSTWACGFTRHSPRQDCLRRR